MPTGIIDDLELVQIQVTQGISSVAEWCPLRSGEQTSTVGNPKLGWPTSANGREADAEDQPRLCLQIAITRHPGNFPRSYAGPAGGGLQARRSFDELRATLSWRGPYEALNDFSCGRSSSVRVMALKSLMPCVAAVTGLYTLKCGSVIRLGDDELAPTFNNSRFHRRDASLAEAVGHGDLRPQHIRLCSIDRQSTWRRSTDIRGHAGQ